MFHHLPLICLLLSVGKAAITDKNCTTPDGKWAEEALDCENKLSDNVCKELVASQTPLAIGTDVERAAHCYQLAGANSEEQKQAMINICPKTCGYCCITPEFHCSNKEFPRVSCSSLTKAQCRDPKWREIIASDCPNVCGFCLEGGCVDAALDCANDKSICRNVDMQDFVQQNCKKTCGYCDKGTGSVTTIPARGCVDKAPNCAIWKKNKFCENNFYTESQKRQYCAKTCGLC